MYGENMAQAGPYCQAFFLVFAIGFLGTPLSMTVYVIEKVWVNMLLNVGYGVVVLGLDLLLIPRYGLLGATIPTALVTLITPFVRYAIARRYLDGIRIPWAFIGRAFLASSPLLGLVLGQAVGHRPAADGLLLLVAAVGHAPVLPVGARARPATTGDSCERSRIPARRWILRMHLSGPAPGASALLRHQPVRAVEALERPRVGPPAAEVVELHLAGARCRRCSRR